VDEAAESYEKADGALVWLAPSARQVIDEQATENSFQGATTRRHYTVPLKQSGGPVVPCSSYVVSPFTEVTNPAEARNIAERMLSTFGDRPEVQPKRFATKAFLDEHLVEHETVWTQQQAFMAGVGLI
jgi:hypothetical protein